MSTPTEATPTSPRGDKERRGIGRVLSRVKTVFKSETSAASKRQSTLGAAGRVKAPATTAAAVKSEPPKPSPAALRRAQFERMDGVTKTSKSKLLEERAKNLNERFGLQIDPSQWQVLQVEDDSIFRMDKPIRMRIRRTCHNCNTNFSSVKECPNCQHVRCKQCVRHPAKRTEAEIAANRERRAAILRANKENKPIRVDYGWEQKPVQVMKRPSKTGGQDLMHKKPRQRVKRTCHECQKPFVKNSKKCDGCGHGRCTDCPRDPAKKDKYPLGYPGDEFGPSSIPHYECHSCQTIFPAGTDHGVACRKCGKEKSESTPRALPRKVDSEPDEEVLKTIQARIASLKVT